MNNLSAVESIFFAALDKGSPEERASYLDQACGPDVELRGCVERMLKAQPRVGSFLQVPAPVQASTVDEPPLTEKPGTMVGPYKLMEQIGEGGMGLVFVAEQQHPVRRKVALKVIKPGMDSREVIGRFEAERQALALMDHPNIAKVLDAGTTDSGRPYFVMELVKGIPIIDYCDQQQLTARERLELFLSVCQAVQHAHGKGIIHRDLKPSNILVAPHDGVPVVKVIDFGVAKAIGQQLTDKTIYTRFTQMIGTPLYMSPEQAEINALDVDIRSDVYSLGVLLYELLTGATPFDRKRFATAAYDEIRRIIREEEPPKPSTRLSTLGETLSKVSAQRKTEPAKLSALVKGDLDWIVMKALEKDRNRRYETASAFAADVRRFLADDPVEARPPSATYKLRKLFRRNKAAVLTTAFVATALVLGTTISAWQAIRATRAETEARGAEEQATIDRERALAAEAKAKTEKETAQAAEAKAKTEKETAQAALNFLWQDMRSHTIPLLESDRDLKVRTLLDRLTARLDKGSGRPPLVEAAVRQMAGQLYLDIGDGPEARKHLKWALNVQRRELGEDDPQTLATMHSLGECLFRMGGPVSAEAREASRILDRTLELRRRVLGDDHRDTLTTMRWAALASPYVVEHEKAGRLYAEAVATGTRKYPNDRETLWAMADYAGYLTFQGKLDQAKDLLTRCLDRCKAFDDQDPFPVLIRERLFWAYLSQNDLAGAELHGNEALKGVRILGGRYPFRATVIAGVARVHQMQGRWDKAAPLIDELQAIGQTASALELRGRALLAEKKYAEAEKPLRESMKINESRPLAFREYLFAQRELGATLLGQKKYAEAEPLLVKNYESLKGWSERPGRDPSPLERLNQVETLEWLVQLYEDWGDHADDAAKWRKELEALRLSQKQSTR
jgi:serine/threonine protein kinase